MSENNNIDMTVTEIIAEYWTIEIEDNLEEELDPKDCKNTKAHVLNSPPWDKSKVYKLYLDTISEEIYNPTIV